MKKKRLNGLCNFVLFLSAGDFRQKELGQQFFLLGGRGGLTGVRLLLNPEWSNMGSLTQLGRIEDRQTILISYF